MFYNSVIDGEIIQDGQVYLSAEICKKIDMIKGILHETKEMRKKPLIGLALPRSVSLIAAIFASLQSHVAFLTLDLRQPKDRIDYMLDFAQVDYILTVSSNEYDFGSRNVVCIDEYDYKINAPDYVDNEDNETAYILYTSGSTGRPKAVDVTRDGFANFLKAIPQIIDFEKGRKISCLSNSTFDIFFLESVLALYQGLSVVLDNVGDQDNPKKIIELLQLNQVDMVQMTPSRIKQLQMIDPDLKCLSSVKTIMVGGEALPDILLKSLQQKTNAKIYNMYGPTETTVWSSVSDLTHKDRVDIGKPINATTICILSEDFCSVAEGEIGEICIGGLGLAKGYLNSPEQTEISFCHLPFEPFERIYRTGDLGKYDGGDILFLGRKDEQIKLRGYRIELDDIDVNMIRISGIIASVTCFDNDPERLVNFYISSEDADIDESKLRKLLSETMPSYMVPSRFCRVENICYTSSGKTDRKAMLQQWKKEKSATKDCNTPSSNGSVDEVTDVIIKIFRGVLEDESSEMTEDSLLLDLGIDSMIYVIIIVQIEGIFGLEVEDEKMFVNSFGTIKDISQYVKDLLSCQSLAKEG